MKIVAYALLVAIACGGLTAFLGWALGTGGLLLGIALSPFIGWTAGSLFPVD